MDHTPDTNEQASTPTDATEGPFGTVPLPEEPVMVTGPTPIDDDLVPMPAWVDQQRREELAEQAETEVPAEPVAEAPAAEAPEQPVEAELAEPEEPTLPKLEPLPSPPETRRIALITQKGGVGKTTTTVNLGAALAASGLRVLMIDLDPQAHLTLSLGLDPDELDLTIYDQIGRAHV